MNYYLITDVEGVVYGAVGTDAEDAVANLADMVGDIEVADITVSDEETVSEYF